MGDCVCSSCHTSSTHSSFHTSSTHPQAVGEYSADCMRWALADAGDSMDDANFETTTANAAILRLTKELAWIDEVLAPGAGEGVEGGRGSQQGGAAVVGQVREDQDRTAPAPSTQACARTAS